MKDILSFAYSGRYTDHELPKDCMPERSMDPRAAYQLIHDELCLDGNSSLNLATFTSTWMEPEADKLMLESAGKNAADMNCYPQTSLIQNRCTAILSRLYHSEQEDGANGACCVGSSEACLLGGLSMKKFWQQRRKREGKDYFRPNMVMCSSLQVVWKKFACFFDVELRVIPISKNRFVLDTDEAMRNVDENTIGIFVILGSTYTGHFDPIKEINDRLVVLNKQTGFDVGIHVDAATGGFIAPFLYPKMEWDFRLPLVRSINVSGHKYGYVYPGIGWIIWRDSTYISSDMIFELRYLGGIEKTCTLNFSRPSIHPILQYYNFIRLGREGYTRIINNCRISANYLTRKIEELGKFDILSPIDGTPLVTMKLKDEVKNYTVYDISSKLKEDGWIVPAYTLPEGSQDISILRIVVKESFTVDMAARFMDSLKKALNILEKTGGTSEYSNGGHAVC